MNILLSFKTPGVLDPILNALEDEEQKEKVREKMKKWLRYGECISVLFDLDTMEATVVEVRS